MRVLFLSYFRARLSSIKLLLYSPLREGTCAICTVCAVLSSCYRSSRVPLIVIISSSHSMAIHLVILEVRRSCKGGKLDVMNKLCRIYQLRQL